MEHIPSSLLHPFPLVPSLYLCLSTEYHLTLICEPEGTSIGRNESEWGHIGVIMIAGTLGWTIELPAAVEYAVLPVGVAIIIPGTWQTLDSHFANRHTILYVHTVSLYRSDDMVIAVDVKVCQVGWWSSVNDNLIQNLRKLDDNNGKYYRCVSLFIHASLVYSCTHPIYPPLLPVIHTTMFVLAGGALCGFGEVKAGKVSLNDCDRCLNSLLSNCLSSLHLTTSQCKRIRSVKLQFPRQSSRLQVHRKVEIYKRLLVQPYTPTWQTIPSMTRDTADWKFSNEKGVRNPNDPRWKPIRGGALDWSVQWFLKLYFRQ